MSIITNILSGPLGQARLVFGAILIGAAVVAVSGGLWYVHNLKTEVVKLTAEKTALVEANKMLQVNIDTVKENATKFSDANNANLGTIKSLLAERSASQKVIADLATTAKSDKEKISKLNANIDLLLKDPANDGIVSPVLRETIRSIQNNRR